MAQTLKFGKGTWATKTGSSMAYNDQNGNYKPLPFNVERDSIATRVNKQGLIEVVGKDKLRIDYTDSAKGVALLENSSTNLIQQSNKFDTYWVLNNITVASEQIGVGGNSEAWKITSSSGSGEKKLNINLSVSGNHAISIYAKKGTKDYVYLRGVTSGLNKRVYFNLAKGIIETDEAISSKMTNMGDGWYRCEAVFNQQSGFEFFFGIAESDNTPSYTDDGTGTIYVQYAQAEANSVASSYIPTSGSSVQRQADVVNGSGNSEVFNDSEGVLFADISALANDGLSRNITISDGTSSNRVFLKFSSTSNLLEATVVSGGVVAMQETYSISDATLYSKLILKYKQNDFSFWVNGFEVGTDSSGNAPTGLDVLDFDSGIGVNDFYGKTKEVGYYDATLTDSELEYLTSYRSLNELVTELNLNTL